MGKKGLIKKNKPDWVSEDVLAYNYINKEYKKRGDIFLILVVTK